MSRKFRPSGMGRLEQLRMKAAACLIAMPVMSLFIMLFASGLKCCSLPDILSGRAAPFALFSPVYQIGAGLEHGFAWKAFIYSLSGLLLSGLIYLSTRRLFSEVEHPIDRGRLHSDTSNYGRAEFEKPWQYRSFAQIRPIEDCIGHIYGMLDEAGRECIDFFPDPESSSAHPNRHIFCIGGSGSGKTFTVGQTYCLQSIKMNHSVIITDPKGELFTKMAAVFRSHGYYVRCLNFHNPSRSDGWDCMKELREESDPAKIELLAGRFASAVVTQICSDLNSIYYTGPNMLLKALLLRLVLDDGIPDGMKNIKQIYAWLTDPGGMDFLDTLFDKDTMKARVYPCLAPWGTFKSSSKNLSGNLITNLGAGVAVLSTGIIADMLSTDSMDLRLPADVPCAYFIQFPVPNVEFRFPVSLFFTMLFERLQQYAVSLPDERLPRDVDFYLDEFAQCGVFPSWEQRISVIRSFGLNVFMVVQTIAQFKTLYKESADTIISNCATWLILGANDLASAELFSKRIGQTTIEVQSETRDPLRNFFGVRANSGDRVSVGTGKAMLLTPDEIMKLPQNTLIICMYGHNPIWANSPPHILHPYFKDMHKLDKGSESFFYDADNNLAGLPVKSEVYSAEKAFIDAYWSVNPRFASPGDVRDAPYLKGNPLLISVLLHMLREDYISFLGCHKKAGSAPPLPCPGVCASSSDSPALFDFPDTLQKDGAFSSAALADSDSADFGFLDSIPEK